MGMTTVYYRIKGEELERLKSDAEFFASIVDQERGRFEMYKNGFLIALGLNPSLMGYPVQSAAVESTAVCSILLGMDGDGIHESGHALPGFLVKNMIIHTALNELEKMDKESVKKHFAWDAVTASISITPDKLDEFFEEEVWYYLMSFKDFLTETTQAGDHLLMTAM